jgi:hypothetical protein
MMAARSLLDFLPGAGAGAGVEVVFPPNRLEKNPPDLGVVVVVVVVVVDLVVVVGSVTVGPVDGAHLAKVCVQSEA